MRSGLSIIVAVILISATVAPACSGITSKNEPDASDVPLSDIIAIDASASAITADGASTVRISAHIPADASTRTVTFSTTTGVFVESAAKEVKVFAGIDSANARKRVASTLLRSDTSTSRAIVRAAIGEYYDTLSVQFTKP